MRRPLLIFATAVALVSSACGGDGDSASDAASEIEQTAGQAASEAQETASEVASEAQETASEVASEAEDTASEAASEAEDATEAAGGRLSEEEMTQQADRLVETLRQRGLTNVASFIETVGLENLVQDTSFTLLAPSDDAFLTLDRQVLAGLLADPQEAVQILQDHLLDERVDRAQLAGMSSVTTSSGGELPVTVNGDTITIGGATVTDADIDAGGGVIHVIDAVIMDGR